MNKKSRERISRLAQHFQGDDATTDQDQNKSQQFSATSATRKPECFNFEPGRLLLNQRAIITGAGSGIGRAAAILFAHHGANITICDLDPQAARATSDFIHNSAGDRCIVVSGDVTDPNFPDRAVKATVDTYGGIDILVLNAGFTNDSVIQKMTPNKWNSMLDVHCTAPFRLIQAAEPYMRTTAKKEIEAFGSARPRCVLTVSSVSGVHGAAGQTNYATAKAGVVGLTKALAKEWGPFNIRANSLVFGYIQTRLVQAKETGASISYKGETVQLGIPQADSMADAMKQMIALGRVGNAEEAAGAMLMLACPYSSYITGQAIEVTGGGWM